MALSACGGYRTRSPHVPGFKRIVIKPYVTGGMQHVAARYRSIHGVIESRWELVEGQMRLHVEVPANTQATVHYPCPADAKVLEDGKPLADSEGVCDLGHDGSYAMFEVASGSYDFTTAEVS